MGGTALGEQLPRIPKARYLDIVEELRWKLRPKFFGYVEVQRSLPDKESFGDVDLIVADQYETLVPERDLSSSKSSTNANVMTFEYGGHQVDLIRVGTTDGIELMRFCCDFGDVGMIVGMLVRGISLKFGQKGLVMVIGVHKLKLSRSLPDILGFLGLDIERWRAGFTSEKEVFDFITTSRYFQAHVFHREKSQDGEVERLVWNRDVRKRDRKRPMFNRFVAYVGRLPASGCGLDKQRIRQCALQVFDKEKEARTIELESQRAKRIKSKFNGSLVMEWSGGVLMGHALGKFMAMFKKSYPNDKLDSMTETEIESAVKDEMIR